MSRLLLLGDDDTATAFAQAGVTTRVPADADAARNEFAAALADAANCIVIVTATVAGWLAVPIREHRTRGGAPMVIEIPDRLSGEFSGGSLMAEIRQAVGIGL